MKAGSGEIVLRFLAAPTDATFSGRVHGGKVLEWIDKAGYACATGWSGRYCVTAYVGDIHFSRPVEIGELVEVHAQLVHTGRGEGYAVLVVLDLARYGDLHCRSSRREHGRVIPTVYPPHATVIVTK